MVLTVPNFRKSMGWTPSERIPTTFPRESTTLAYANSQSPTAPAGQLSASRMLRGSNNDGDA